MCHMRGHEETSTRDESLVALTRGNLFPVYRPRDESLVMPTRGGLCLGILPEGRIR